MPAYTKDIFHFDKNKTYLNKLINFKENVIGKTMNS